MRLIGQHLSNKLLYTSLLSNPSGSWPSMVLNLQPVLTICQWRTEQKCRPGGDLKCRPFWQKLLHFYRRNFRRPFFFWSFTPFRCARAPFSKRAANFLQLTFSTPLSTSTFFSRSPWISLFRSFTVNFILFAVLFPPFGRVPPPFKVPPGACRPHRPHRFATAVCWLCFD